MYVGANDGALHAFATENLGAYTRGQEVWAFVPPFIAAKLPGIINDALDGIKPGNDRRECNDWRGFRGFC